MSAIQVTSPCWILGWDGDKRTDAEAAQGSHYSDPRKMPGVRTGRAAFHDDCGGVVMFGLSPFCLGCEDENPQWTEHQMVPRALPACWTVRCDGDCEDELEDEEDGSLHFRTRTAAEHGASNGYGWRFLADGSAFCEDDAPAGAYLVGVNVPGQMALPEVPGD